ncbi:MAG: short-chain dehydrogenase [Actinobacteria bacterium]|nr:MAG: short-chain dehydrogenase [Actinomycetota bacterium]
MDMGLAGRRVLVTGASRGIGLATARAFAKEGARVAITYGSDEARARAVVADLPDARCLRCRMEDPEDPRRVVAELTECWGGVDVLVANALRRGRRRNPTEHMEDVAAQEWGPLVYDNLAGTIRMVQHVLPGMRRNGWGRIVLVSSHIAWDGSRGQEFYGATKAALYGLARSLAWDVGRDGILVNVVSPGLTATDGVLTALPEAVRRREAELTPTGRLSRPEEIAATIVFLGSAANGHISGENVTVAGGR